MTNNRGLRPGEVGTVESEERGTVPGCQLDPLAVASGIDHAERGQPAAAASALLSMGHIFYGPYFQRCFIHSRKKGQAVYPERPAGSSPR